MDTSNRIDRSHPIWLATYSAAMQPQQHAYPTEAWLCHAFALADEAVRRLRAIEADDTERLLDARGVQS